MHPDIPYLTRLYGSGPRQRLENAMLKSRRVLADSTEEAADVRVEVARLRNEIALLEKEQQGAIYHNFLI